jgi:hypothetical protein
MKRAWLIPLLAYVSGCGLFNVSTGASGGTGGASSAAATTGGGTTQGIDCGADPTTGVTLCLGISSCSGLSIDTEVYPGCGFRVNGAAIDVECVCGDFLCPLGPTPTCDAAQQLLAQDNEGVVCAQASAGQCTEVAAGASASASSSSGAGGGMNAGSCDPTCEQECDGDPTCIQYTCGC